MNRQLNRLAVAVVLLVALVVATTYWQTWASAGLQDKQDNAIQRVVQFSIARGLITGNGAVFAANKKKKLNGQTLYYRRYPQHGRLRRPSATRPSRARRRGSSGR